MFSSRNYIWCSQKYFRSFPFQELQGWFFQSWLPFLLYNVNFRKLAVDIFFFSVIIADCLIQQKNWVYWLPVHVFLWCIRLNTWEDYAWDAYCWATTNYRIFLLLLLHFWAQFTIYKVEMIMSCSCTKPGKNEWFLVPTEK